MNFEVSVGMAVFEDFRLTHGQEYKRAQFTARALLLNHPLVKEVVVVDNSPKPCQDFADFLKKCERARYVHAPEPAGTASPRNRVFAESKSEFTCCVDPHVLLANNFFESAARFYEVAGRDCPDLVHGPMLTESNSVMATHMNDQWRAGMWGTWGVGWVAPDGKGLFSVMTYDDRDLTYLSMPESGEQQLLSPEEVAALGLPNPVAWAGHEPALLKLGCRLPRRPFVIPGHGMGMFLCRTDAWLPFASECRGFGGEEMTTGVRYRQAGRRCWCVPGAAWWHDFGRVGGTVPYRLTQWDKIRNYVIEFRRLGLDVEIVRRHFQSQCPVGEWNQIVSGMTWPEKRAPGVSPWTHHGTPESAHAGNVARVGNSPVNPHKAYGRRD